MELSALGRCYRSFLRCIALISKLPVTIGYYLAPWLAYYGFSPIRQDEALIKQALSDAGWQFSLIEWQQLWRKRLADHAIFCLNIFKQPAFNATWVKQHVSLDSELLDTLLAEHNSVLFLTYHHAYQHSLCGVLGVSGWHLNALAAPEESSAIFAFIGPYIRKLHQGCAMHFNGGKYLFFDRDMTGARMTKRALTEGGILISLNDFASPAEKCTAIPVFNRFISAPAGSVKLACRMGIPIVAGGMLRHGQDYKVVIRQLDNSQDVAAIMRDYFAFLAEIVADSPHFWDGWNWFSALPSDVPENIND